MLALYDWPNVILHLDGDAFFASVLQAVNPALKGKPVVAGGERGIATAFSYEAKKYGVKRAMTIAQVKKVCPSCIILDSDYKLYGLFSKKMFDILRTYSPTVEEYSIDEGFADLKGLQRPLNMSYEEIGKTIQRHITSSLGIPVSVGISLTKSLAKLASSFHKPQGMTLIKGRFIEQFLRKVPVEHIWGIGPNTSAYLKKLGVVTALDFACLSEEFVQKQLTKPFREIWTELRGQKVYDLNTQSKETYQSISHTQTFSPPTMNKDILWARLSSHVEEAFKKARHFNYRTGKVFVFLKTQNFRYQGKEIKLMEKTSYPFLIRKELRAAFENIYRPYDLYRTTGCTLSDLEDASTVQPQLFRSDAREIKATKIYPLYEEGKIDFGTKLLDKPTSKEKPEGSKPTKGRAPLNLPYATLQFVEDT